MKVAVMGAGYRDRKHEYAALGHGVLVSDQRAAGRRRQFGARPDRVESPAVRAPSLHRAARGAKLPCGRIFRLNAAAERTGRRRCRALRGRGFR